MRLRALAPVVVLVASLAACESPGPTGAPPDAGTDAGAPAPEAAPAPGGLAGWLRQLDRVRRIHASPPPGTLTVPVQGARASRIADTFGAPRGNRRHEGVDVFAPAGTPVLAAAGGLVVQVGTNNLGGRVVTVWGDGNRRYYYAHLERHGAYREGDIVEAGDVLGFVGNTGNARTTPPHLHFGIYDPGWKAIDPLPLLLASD